MQVPTQLQLKQFMVNLNHATTGKPVNTLVIAEWNNTRNFAYVLLSRVRTLSGLKLLEKILDDYDCKPAGEALDMMARLRSRIKVTK